MFQQVLAADAEPCIWMCAGLVSYRLCTRDFDCEHCPLDSALHGNGKTDGDGALPRGCWDLRTLPDDRRYSGTHTWAQAQRAGTWRIGIDGFAAALIANVSGVRWAGLPDTRISCAQLCTIDTGLGALTVAAPLPGGIIACNHALEHHPRLLVSSPYDDGWIADVAVSDDDAARQLMDADAAHDQITLDLRRFRRAIAIHLFAATTISEPAAHRAEQVSDLRSVISAGNYADLLRDLIA